jgi:hypothetical protein
MVPLLHAFTVWCLGGRARDSDTSYCANLNIYLVTVKFVRCEEYKLHAVQCPKSCMLIKNTGNHCDSRPRYFLVEWKVTTLVRRKTYRVIEKEVYNFKNLFYKNYWR